MINSKKLFALAFFLSIIIFVSTTKAADQLLVTFSSDVNNDNYDLVISSTDPDQFLTGFTIGNSTNSKEIPVTQFIKNGINLYQKGVRSFAKISSNNFNKQDGGVIILNTVYNFWTNKEKNYELELVKDQSEWKLFFEGRQITQIYALTNKLPLFGLVGVKNLIMK